MTTRCLIVPRNFGADVFSGDSWESDPITRTDGRLRDDDLWRHSCCDHTARADGPRLGLTGRALCPSAFSSFGPPCSRPYSSPPEPFAVHSSSACRGSGRSRAEIPFLGWMADDVAHRNSFDRHELSPLRKPNGPRPGRGYNERFSRLCRDWWASPDDGCPPRHYGHGRRPQHVQMRPMPSAHFPERKFDPARGFDFELHGHDVPSNERSRSRHDHHMIAAGIEALSVSPLRTVQATFRQTRRLVITPVVDAIYMEIESSVARPGAPPGPWLD